MTQYVVKIGFWLRAYDSVAVEAGTDTEAIEQAKAVAAEVMQLTLHPEHIDLDERREGIISFIDRETPEGRVEVEVDIEFDGDRIPSLPASGMSDHQSDEKAGLVAPLTQDQFDDLVDDATHAVNNLIPDNVIASLSASAHTTLLQAINDALTLILADHIEHGD